MPSTRPCAAFEPISPDFDVKALVESTENFEWVVRIHCDMIDHQGLEAFEKLVLIHVILGGKPLVVEGYENRLDRWTFAVQWLRDNLGSKVENPRDLTKKATVPMTFGHYLNHMALLTNQWTPYNYKDSERQRIYLKDIDCPSLWHDKLRSVLPPFLYYLNDSTGDFGGFGAVDEPDPSGSGMRRGKGIGKAGDLMSTLPKEIRAENMMCYIGHEGTYTPSHREMCASLGHNIMVEASTGLVEDGKPTKAGSSIWFMTESKERQVVAEYWLSKLGHDIEIENHFAQINAWKSAPFKTWVVEQKPGDFILIPPLAPHQVWNRGSRTMKVAWNRTTVETLELALNEALPNARMVCRDEQYKNKAMIYFALQKYSKLLHTADKFKQRQRPGSKQKNDIKVRQLEKDFRRLHGLFTQVLLSESFSPLPQQQEKPEFVEFEGFITCSYCRSNIFNRFLTCPSCVVDVGEGEQDAYDICMDCYVMGRSCACISKLRWVEQHHWSDLMKKHDACRQQIIAYEGKITDKSPMSLKIELQRLGTRRTLAQICQIELKRRPWRDISKPPPQVDGIQREEEVELDINGNVKKAKKKIRRSEKFVRDHSACHIDKHWEPKWKQAECTECGKSWCYGTLFRAFDLKPQDIMADPKWTCPSCRKICGCRDCRKKPGYQPYTPSTTYLGNNTKIIADPRSVESLVDFSVSNIAWIQKAGDDTGDNTRRLKRRRHEADAAQAHDPELGEDYAEEQGEDVEDRVLRLAQHEGIPIDPALAATGVSTPSGADSIDDDEDIYEENPEGSKHDRSRGPPIPQYVVPEGGVIRNSEHAYDFTEAITYDYPDPDAGLSAIIPDPVAEPDPSGYGPAVPGSPGDRIEMVNRKRKRNKLDDGDKAFVYNKKRESAMPKLPEKQKKRQSFIVKLSINKDKLAEVNKMAVIAQRALNGANIPAPVIGSDLQALNTTPNVEGQPPTKKARLEIVEIDQDDDFTPGRRRDRRKQRHDGIPLSDPDAEITRRTTRMQAVTYEEPDEEEFNEVVERPKSKLATMEHAIERESVNGEDQRTEKDDVVGVGDGPEPMDIDDLVVDRPSSSDSISPSRPSATLQPKLSTHPTISGKALRPSTASPATSKKEQAKALVEAQANRKAKMAALDWMDNDSDDLDDEFSDDGEQPTGAAFPPEKQLSQPPSSSSQRNERSVERGKSATLSNGVSPPAAPTTITAFRTISNAAPRIASDLPSNRETRPALPGSVPKSPATPQASKDPPRAASSHQPVPKSAIVATTADWGESDSDDDSEEGDVEFSSIPVTAKGARMSSGGGRAVAWASINQNQNSRGGMHSGSMRGRGGGRGRGRGRLKASD